MEEEWFSWQVSRVDQEDCALTFLSSNLVAKVTRLPNETHLKTTCHPNLLAEPKNDFGVP